MIGKNPLFVARQHGHSVTTMFRTYAAWMQNAPESDIQLIRSAMKARKSARRPNLKRESHSRIEPVAKLATGLATGEMASGPRMLEFSAKRSGGEGGITRRSAPRPSGAALRALSPLRCCRGRLIHADRN